MNSVFAAFAFSLVVPLFTLSANAAAGCDGEFLRASDGQQWVEGGLEPSGVSRLVGDKLHFQGWDESEGQRFVVADDETLFAEGDVKIADGCKLTRVEKY